MTDHMRDYLKGLAPVDASAMVRSSVTALQMAWPHRQSRRGRIVIESNVTMLRNLKEARNG